MKSLMKSLDWKKYILETGSPDFSLRVEDNTLPYGSNTRQLSLFFGLDLPLQSSTNIPDKSMSLSTGLAPIIKWPGGKEKELKYIIPHAPVFERFFEPFVGGGSVFMGIQAREYYINDFSSELIDLYNCIASGNVEFYNYVNAIDCSWQLISSFFRNNSSIISLYLQYKEDILSVQQIKNGIDTFLHEHKSWLEDEILQEPFKGMNYALLDEVKTCILRKMRRMKQLEKERTPLPYKDVVDNIETAFKSALYNVYRSLYNDGNLRSYTPVIHCALFFFIRNYAYSGMFRYSSRGEFNVPYGGIAYNSKLLAKKLSYYKSAPVQNHFSITNIFNLDFEQFMVETQPGENDFVFLDPPYDSEFSTYAQNSFTCCDHERLANFMINRCRAKWMLIIKNTPFIHKLYNREGITIRSFEKEYLVSFMNRNDKKVTHLLITNY